MSTSSLPRFFLTGRFLQILVHLPDFARLYWRLFRDRRVAALGIPLRGGRDVNEARRDGELLLLDPREQPVHEVVAEIAPRAIR